MYRLHCELYESLRALIFLASHEMELISDNLQAQIYVNRSERQYLSENVVKKSNGPSCISQLEVVLVANVRARGGSIAKASPSPPVSDLPPRAPTACHTNTSDLAWLTTSHHGPKYLLSLWLTSMRCNLISRPSTESYSRVPW